MTRVNGARHQRPAAGRLSLACRARHPPGMANTVERNRNLVVRLAADELEMMHEIAAVERETAATLIRRWIRQQAEVRGINVTRAARKGA
jgi:hypothetical protein